MACAPSVLSGLFMYSNKSVHRFDFAGQTNESIGDRGDMLQEISSAECWLKSSLCLHDYSQIILFIKITTNNFYRC